MSTDACEGIRILEVTNGFCSAALCGQILAGLGAQVVKLEPSGGDALRTAIPRTPDGVSHAFHILNAAKQSVVASKEQWERLVEWADILIVDPLACLEMGGEIGHTEFVKKWPTKILCTVSIFGQETSRERWAGNELIAEALSGLMTCTGYPEKPPVRCGVPFGMHVTALFAFQGVMAALREREKSGTGQWLDVSVVDALVCLLGNFIPSYFLTGRSPKRIGNRHTIAAPWNLYQTSDGYVVICTGTGGSGWWESVTEAIGRPELASDPKYDKESKRVAHVDEVDKIVTDWTINHTSAEVIKLMTEVGIPVNGISSVKELASDPHYSEMRAMIGSATLRMENRNHEVPLIGKPFKIKNWAPPSTLGPMLGENELDGSPNASAVKLGTTEHKTAAGCLKGIRVLEFGSRTSVPMAGRLLADLGADVIKIEPPKGESLRNGGQPIGGSSYIFHINNAGKRSVVIDPDDPIGRDLIVRLAANADVWLENLAPGALERMGLGYDALKKANPQITYCSVSGFGLKSHFGGKKAFDSVVQAASGIMHMTGYPDHLPVKIGISASDLAVGVALVGAVLAALRQKELSGEGMQVDLAMADIGVWMTQATWPDLFYGSGHPTRVGNRSTTDSPHNVFQTKDGLVAIAVESNEQWRRILNLIGEQCATEERLQLTADERLRQTEVIEKLVSEWTADMTSIQVTELCQAQAIPAAPVRNLDEVVKDPDVVRRGLIVEVHHPIAGKMNILGNPLKFSKTPTLIDSCAPPLGEHTESILKDWLNISEAQLAELVDNKTIVIRKESEKAAA